MVGMEFENMKDGDKKVSGAGVEKTFG